MSSKACPVSNDWPKQTNKMSFEVDFQQFLVDLPGQLSQARRQAFSSNLNMLEFWDRRLQDFSHVISVFIRRCEGATGTPENLRVFLRELLEEISNLHHLIENNILTDEDYIAEMSAQFLGCPEEDNNGAYGCFEDFAKCRRKLHHWCLQIKKPSCAKVAHSRGYFNS